jgi:hypothetical protein
MSASSIASSRPIVTLAEIIGLDCIKSRGSVADP